MKTRNDLTDYDLMRECLRQLLQCALKAMKAVDSEYDSEKLTDCLTRVIPLLRSITPDVNEARIKAVEAAIKDLQSFKALMVAKNQLKTFQGGGTISIAST